MAWTTQAILDLRRDLSEIQTRAASLPWGTETTWLVHRKIRTERRLWVRRDRDSRVVCVDLHGLDAALAHEVCTTALRLVQSPEHPLRYVRFIVGMGHRSTTDRRVLAELVGTRIAATPSIRSRLATQDAPRGFYDVWNPAQWPRPQRSRGSTPSREI